MSPPAAARGSRPLEGRGIWTCGHATDLAHLPDRVISGVRGPETRCESCDAHVLPWPFPVRDGHWADAGGYPPGQYAAPRPPLPMVPRPAPLLPAAATHLGHAYADAAAELEGGGAEAERARRLSHLRTVHLLRPAEVRSSLSRLTELMASLADAGAWQEQIAWADAFSYHITRHCPASVQEQVNWSRAHQATAQALGADINTLAEATLVLDEAPTCPILCEPLRDPVTLSCGHSLEHEAARGLIAEAEGGCRCPLCRSEVYPWPVANLPMRAAIDALGAAADAADQPPRMPAVPLPIDAHLDALIREFMRPDIDLAAHVADLPPSAALARIQDALQQRPHVLPWLALRAETEEACGLSDRAHVTWSLVARRAPQHPQAVRKVAVAALAEGQYRTAQRLLERRLRCEDATAAEALLLIDAHHQAGNHLDVERWASLALRDWPLDDYGRGQAYSYRAHARLFLGQDRPACRDLARFYALDVGRNALSQEVEQALALTWGQPLLRTQLFFFGGVEACQAWTAALWLWVAALLSCWWSTISASISPWSRPRSVTP